MKKKDALYLSPQLDWNALSPLELLCTSPETGEIEDVEYEDWVVNG